MPLSCPGWEIVKSTILRKQEKLQEFKLLIQDAAPQIKALVSAILPHHATSGWGRCGNESAQWRAAADQTLGQWSPKGRSFRVQICPDRKFEVPSCVIWCYMHTMTIFNVNIAWSITWFSFVLVGLSWFDPSWIPGTKPPRGLDRRGSDKSKWMIPFQVEGTPKAMLRSVF